MKIEFIALFICVILSVSPAAAQVKNPTLPDSPLIVDNIDFSQFSFRARVSVSGKGGFTEGSILLTADSIVTADRRAFRIKDISRVTVIEWKRRADEKKNIFYPSRYELLFNDFRKINIDGNIESLNRFKLSARKPVSLFMFYYDSFKDGKWINSGTEGYDAQILKPAAGAVVSIEFLQ